MNFEHAYAVIMAGGGGTRLWPLSRQAKPKQLANIFDQGTLFQMAIERLLGLFTYDRIYIVTVADQVEDLRRDCPEIPAENFLIEPTPRGTASVIGLGAVALENRDSKAIMVVLTADHFIKEVQVFHNLLRASIEVASDNYLVTMGITPTSPSTGYGYIQHGEELGHYQGLSAYLVKKFKEKPAIEQAREFVDRGDHDWNSGMFVWKTDTILREFDRQMPELAAGLWQISASWKTPDRNSVVRRVWPGIKPQTIDYGIMEHADRVVVIPATGMGWSDVGSWDSLFEVLPSDEKGNVISGGENINLDTSETLIFSKGSGRLIVTIGVKDLVIVDTGDALLVCDRSQTQKVRDIVNQLKVMKRIEYL
jgi:mannose-1-phosphate guanylyltransferase